MNYQRFHDEVMSRAYSRDPGDQSQEREAGLAPGATNGFSLWNSNFSIDPNIPAVSDWQRLYSQDPDRLFLSVNLRTPPLNNDDDFQRSNVNMPPPLPRWIWIVLVTALGIGARASQKRFYVATILHILTLSSAFVFGACGLFFNIYDTLSEVTKTTVLVSVAKSILGLYWIGLGVYANTLAARLFSSTRILNCIRLHSKTFLKVNTSFIVTMLAVAAVLVNLYTNQFLLEDQSPANGTMLKDANCASIGIHVFLCTVYFGSKVVYSCFCLAWNLLVVGIFLSVCRTHTISIRRFMKELLYDTKIYMEFCKIQNLEKTLQTHKSSPNNHRPNQQQPTDNLHSGTDSSIWDDDIAELDLDPVIVKEHSSNAEVLQALKSMRISASDELSDIANSQQGQDTHPMHSLHTLMRNTVRLLNHIKEDEECDSPEEMYEKPSTSNQNPQEIKKSSEMIHKMPSTSHILPQETNKNSEEIHKMPSASDQHLQETKNSSEMIHKMPSTSHILPQETNKSSEEIHKMPSTSNQQAQEINEELLKPNSSDENGPIKFTSKMEARKLIPTVSMEQEEYEQKDTSPNSQSNESTMRDFLIGQGPPIMSNEELLFTYFQLLRRLSSTSRLLQRWISNWITFVMLWCGLLIVYWTTHTAQISGIIQFLIPLVSLGFLTSGYAEVNFEGERLIKCILPTEERMTVIYYFQNSKLELKIFSFTMTYNTIVTVVAGIAVTFATRIILDQFSLGKSHLF